MLTLIMAAGVALVDVPDPITDKPQVFVVSEAPRARLLIGCDSTRQDGVVAIVESQRTVLGGYNVLTNEKLVTYRFDHAPPITNIWLQNPSAAMLTGRAKMAEFLRGAIKASIVTIRTARYDQSDIDFTFSIDGADQPIRTMLDRCGAAKLSRDVFSG